MRPDAPLLPLPPPIRSSTPGTWAHDTMSRRVRENILARVFRENDFHSPVLDNLRILDRELTNSAQTPLSPLPEDDGPDIKLWNETILVDAIEKGETWLSAPWVVAEFYLYRRLMSALDYFRSPMDPFRFQKELGLTSAIASITTLAGRVNEVLDGVKKQKREEVLKEFKAFVLTALWGNRMDLSLWPVGGGDEEDASDAFANVLEVGQRRILSNNIDKLAAYMAEWAEGGRVDIIVDNAGFELFCDLCLADFLVETRLADVVYLQVKAYPVFVSDAMEKDVKWSIEFLQRGGAEEADEVRRLGERWARHVNERKWVLNEDYFWVQPQPMWQMPQHLKEEMQQSSLVFVKGDANYRRLIGERCWELDAPFDSILAYFPAPICALRTLKAELGCGMDKESTERAAREDQQWMVAGKYGVVQFCDTRSSR